MEEITGEIISTQLGTAPKAGKHYGYIVVRTPKDEDIKLKVDANTDYQVLDRGAKVRIKYEPLKSTDLLVAREILQS